MTGKKSRPNTQPIYSEGNRNDFLISSGFELRTVPTNSEVFLRSLSLCEKNRS